jgi:hypothetical protein
MKNPSNGVRILIAILSIGLSISQPLSAQVDPWERVKLIEPGKSVHVKLHTGRTVKGRMESWNAEGLSLRQGKDKVVNLTKSDVAAVAMPTGMSRGRKAAYGALVGGGVGAGLMGGVCAAGADCDVHPGAMAAGGAIWFGGITAGIAALFPQHKEVIYLAGSAKSSGPSPNPPVARPQSNR